jgi:MFS family permease
MKSNLVLFSAAVMTWGLGEGVFILFQPLYLQELGANPLRIGSLLGLASMAAMLSFLPVGYLTDRFGQRPFLRLTCMIGVFATILMATASSLTAFTFGMVLYGISTCFAIPMSSFLTAARGKMSIARVLTLNTAFYNLGAAFGSFGGGIIGERFGLRMNFWAALPILVFSTFLTFLIRPNVAVTDNVNTADKGLKALLRGGFPLFTIMTFFIMFGMYLPQPLSQYFLQNERHVNLESIGQLIAARSIGIVILNLAMGHLNAIAGMLISQVFMGLFTLSVWLGSGLPVYLVGYMLLGSYMTARGMVIAQGRILVHASNISMAYGVLNTAMSIASVFGPPAAGALYALHPEWTYAASLLLIFIGIAVNLIFSPVKMKNLVAFDEHERAQWTQP